MIRGDPRGKPRVVQQSNLFRGVAVVSLYGEAGRVRANLTHCPSERRAREVVAQVRQREHAELVEQPDQELRRLVCPKCQRTGGLDHDFGTRTLNGERVRQSWCRTCRSQRADTEHPLPVS